MYRYIFADCSRSNSIVHHAEVPGGRHSFTAPSLEFQIGPRMLSKKRVRGCMSSYDVISIVVYRELVVGSVIQATRFVGFEDGLRVGHLNGLSMNEN